jgi:hypothetical protein
MQMNRGAATWIIGLCGISVAVLAGCGSSYDVATVHGRVTFNGEPVPGGAIRFVPVVAEGVKESPPEASGDIDENGNFTLSTLADGDGAVLGKHRVVFTRPDIEDEEEDIEAAEQDGDLEALAELKAEIELSKRLAKFSGHVPEPGEVTVVSGDNEFTFELVAGDEEDEDD